MAERSAAMSDKRIEADMPAGGLISVRQPAVESLEKQKENCLSHSPSALW